MNLKNCIFILPVHLLINQLILSSKFVGKIIIKMGAYSKINNKTINKW